MLDFTDEDPELPNVIMKRENVASMRTKHTFETHSMGSSPDLTYQKWRNVHKIGTTKEAIHGLRPGKMKRFTDARAELTNGILER